MKRETTNVLLIFAILLIGAFVVAGIEGFSGDGEQSILTYGLFVLAGVVLLYGIVLVASDRIIRGARREDPLMQHPGYYLAESKEGDEMMRLITGYTLDQISARKKLVFAMPGMSATAVVKWIREWPEAEPRTVEVKVEWAKQAPRTDQLEQVGWEPFQKEAIERARVK